MAMLSRMKLSFFLVAAVILAALVLLFSEDSAATERSSLAADDAQNDPDHAALSTSGPTGGGCWSVYGLPIPPANWTPVYDVAAIAADDVWSLSLYETTGGHLIRMLHWDGIDWQVVPSPELPAYTGNRPPQIEVISANDIWVSTNYNTAAPFMHWDGTQWRLVHTPRIDIFVDISAASTDDVWALGSEWAVHWDGNEWTEVEVPHEPAIYVTTIEAIAADDVWIGAVTGQSPIRWHWDGTQWTGFQAPTMGEVRGIQSMTALASDDVWAVGYRSVNGGTDNETLVEHWNGTNWQIIPSPSFPGINGLEDVSALAADDVWAVGYGGDSSNAIMAIHWDGSSWSVVSSPDVHPGMLYGVAAVSPNDVWAVGAWGDLSRPYMVRYTDPCLPPTSTPTATSTPTPSNTGTPTNTATPVPHPYCWAALDPPFAGTDTYTLNDVDAISPNDVWAVGSNTFSPAQSVVLHWNGVQWTNVPLPALSGLYLSEVEAISSNNVWVMAPDGATLAWNGSQWTQMPGPGGASDFVAISANDMWATKNFLPCGKECNGVAIMRWNGSGWSQTYFTGCFWYCLLNVIHVFAPNNILVGGYGPSYPFGGWLFQWNGTQWTDITDPIVRAAGRIDAIAGISPSDYWLGTDAGLLHWDGSTWTTYSRFNVAIVDMVALAPNDVWAVGHNGILHWDGVQWGRVENAPGQVNLNAITATGANPNDLWAVGASYDPDNHGMLLAHYGVPCQLITPVPTLTYTPTATPTSTPTATNTPLPPRCPDERFTDVCPTDYFYPHVLDLNDLDIVSGYNTVPPCDGPAHIPCFKPYSLTTRGQVSKIISLSAGFNEPISGQTFQDVPPDHTFYQYIERMASRDIIIGYLCGYHNNEPCIPPDSRPYFRPGVTVNRAQLSKMTALSFGFQDPASGQTFEDVVPENHFYPFIENLAGRNIINGYPCGTPGEPCVPPGNRPYFRYANPITRGQVAKIVNLARLQSLSTPTPAVTITSTSTPTSTPVILTPSATPTCCTDVTGSISGSCQPAPYTVNITINNSCSITLIANIASQFQVSPNSSGPWQTLYIGDCFDCPIPPGTSQETTTVFSGPLPAGNNWWRYTMGYYGVTCVWSLLLETEPQPACVSSTITPSPTSNTPTSTPTP